MPGFQFRFRGSLAMHAFEGQRHYKAAETMAACLAWCEAEGARSVGGERLRLSRGLKGRVIFCKPSDSPGDDRRSPKQRTADHCLDPTLR